MTLPHSHSAPHRTQNTCCHLSSITPGSCFCDVCGKPLIRCMAYEECAGLLDNYGLCTVCVSPHLQIDAGALIAAKVGGSVALPIRISNMSMVGRPLFITALWSREGGETWREERLGWEQLGAAQSRPITITADEFSHAGVHNIEILLAVATRWRWRQESYVFSANISLNIEDTHDKSGPVINISGEGPAHGNAVYIGGQANKERKRQMSESANTLPLIRAEKEERRLKLRGLSEGLWIPRHTKLQWQDFHDGQSPMNGPILNPDGILAFGRSRTQREDGTGDVRLLIYSADGKLDEGLSRKISRRHFELYIECDRLTLRVTAGGGLCVNKEKYREGSVIHLVDGDVIYPLTKARNALSIKTKFQTEHGRVNSVTFTRANIRKNIS